MIQTQNFDQTPDPFQHPPHRYPPSAPRRRRIIRRDTHYPEGGRATAFFNTEENPDQFEDMHRSEAEYESGIRDFFTEVSSPQPSIQESHVNAVAGPSRIARPSTPSDWSLSYADSPNASHHQSPT
ncbi:hypothetical protein VKT23_015248 [Stygiomarasmius scandens]|uniref:Uncharacterized protein n=1 Tax=Marasmiellus scandens TaxID=2682957 RepID=A0ABR1IYN9_9AGAR